MARQRRQATVLSEGDAAVLRRLIDQAKKLEVGKPHYPPDGGRNFQAPEYYIALVPEEGIDPAVTADTGEVIPGEETCQIHKIVESNSCDGCNFVTFNQIVDAEFTELVFNPTGSRIQPGFTAVGRDKFGNWIVVTSAGSPDFATTTTTTKAPCAGYCKYTWSAATKTWTLTTDTCTNPTTTTTTSTTTGSPTTTTTVNPCLCSTTSTTTSAPTTPTPCACLKPTFCGFEDEDCVYTNCARGVADYMPDCGTTSTTTSEPTTTTSTTTCDCNTSTTANPATSTVNPSPGCSLGCSWFWNPISSGWTLTSNGCASSCPCQAPSGGGNDCEIYNTPCITIPPTTTPAPSSCTGTCTYWYISGGWVLDSQSVTCAGGTVPCQCPPPSQPGNDCSPTIVSCVAISPTTTTSNPAATTTTAAPTLCAHCYTTTTAAPVTTTTTSSSCRFCFWRWSGSAWEVIVNACGPSCACLTPSIDGHETCEITKNGCVLPTTTSTTSTTTTTTTSTTTTTPPPGCCYGTANEAECDAISGTWNAGCCYGTTTEAECDAIPWSTTWVDGEPCGSDPCNTPPTTTTPVPCGTCTWMCNGANQVWYSTGNDCSSYPDCGQDCGDGPALSCNDSNDGAETSTSCE